MFWLKTKENSLFRQGGVGEGCGNPKIIFFRPHVQNFFFATPLVISSQVLLFWPAIAARSIPVGASSVTTLSQPARGINFLRIPCWCHTGTSSYVLSSKAPTFQELTSCSWFPLATYLVPFIVQDGIFLSSLTTETLACHFSCHHHSKLSNTTVVILLVAQLLTTFKSSSDNEKSLDVLASSSTMLAYATARLVLLGLALALLRHLLTSIHHHRLDQVLSHILSSMPSQAQELDSRSPFPVLYYTFLCLYAL